MTMLLSSEIKARMRVPHALRRVPAARLASLLAVPERPESGDIALARLEKIGKNMRLELIDGRTADLHEEDLLAVVFGNRYATEQFEGEALTNGDSCDLLSMGGMCGLVLSKHASVVDPSRLRLLGALGDDEGRPLRLRDYALASIPPPSHKPRVVVVCGTGMDSGKTYTAMSLVMGLRLQRQHVATIKLTGTAAGRDTWRMHDAGANPALDFIDGGYPSTYLCGLENLLKLHGLLLTHAASGGAEWIVIEIADGLLQRETASLLQNVGFTRTVDAWVLAASDSLSALGAVQLMRDWGIEPIAASGLMSLSPLGMREAQAAIGARCLTAQEIQQGGLNESLDRATRPPSAASLRGVSTGSMDAA